MLKAKIVEKKVVRKYKRYFRISYSLEEYHKTVTTSVSPEVFDSYAGDSNIWLKVSNEKPWTYRVVKEEIKNK